MENTLAEQYNDIICEAIDTIVNSRLSEIKFDQTIICTITDISKRDQGEYTVTDGSITFQAFSDSKNYSNNSQVQVLIPSGDWTAQKRIIGRYSSDTDNDPIAYVAPTDQVVNLSGNLIENPENIFQLVANFNQDKKIWTTIDDNGNIKPSKSFTLIPVLNLNALNLDTKIYNTICIKGKFQTYFEQFNMYSGTYGILLRIYATNAEGVNTQVELNFASDKDMFGRVYNFANWVSQEQAYVLNESIGFINKIEAEFYQDGKFITFSEEQGLPNVVIGADAVAGNEAVNIQLTDLEIFLGANVATVQDNTVRIYTNNELNYTPGKNDKKTLSLIWYNKEEGNLFVDFKDGIGNKDFAMNNEIQPPENDKNNYYWVQWYADGRDGAVQLIKEQDPVEEKVILEDLECISNLSETDVYAIVWLNKQQYKSNIITFTNQTSKSSLVLGKDVEISIKNSDEKTKDIYPIYGEDNLAIRNEAVITRTVEMDWHWNFGIIEIDWWVGASIEWKLPENNTMLKYLYSKNSNSYGGTIEDADVYELDQEGNKILKAEKSDKFKFSYRLSDYYNPLYQNNTITCIVTKPQDENQQPIILTANKTISLTTQGTFGTDYTLVVAPIDDRPYGFVKNSEDKWIAELKDFKATLVDLNNQELEVKPNLTISQHEGEQYDGYNLIEATVSTTWAGRIINLQTKYPLIYSKDNNYSASVPIKIVYDSFGSLTNIMKNGAPLELYFNNEKQSVQWEIVYSFTEADSKDEETYQRKLSQMPRLVNNTLIAPSMYTDIAETAYLKATSNGSVLWTSPLIVEQHKYGSEVLNNWDGQTIIDKDNNRILTNAFAAGYMDTDNAFNGVILGEVGNIDGETPEKKTGLYGYQNGAQTYGFKDDGTAFIGGSRGGGRINFDGVKGIIASSAWIDNNGIKEELNEGESGLLINLQTGELKSNNFSIDSAGNASFTGEITATKLTLLGAKIDYSDIDNAPIIPDVSIYIAKDGAITGNEDGAVRSFEVTSQGLLTATNAIITGQITASSGMIGGIEISPGAGLHYSGTDANDGFGLWKYGIHPSGATSNSIIFHAGGNDNNIGTAPFRVLADGTVYADKAIISGTITANAVDTPYLIANNSSSKIAGWTIKENKLTAGTLGSDGFIGLYTSFKAGDGNTNDETSAIIAGHEDDSWRLIVGPNFGVNNKGELYATGANITGTINAQSGGKIGEWSISGGLKHDGVHTNVEYLPIDASWYKYSITIKNLEILTTYVSFETKITKEQYTGQIEASNFTSESELLKHYGFTSKDLNAANYKTKRVYWSALGGL